MSEFALPTVKIKANTAKGSRIINASAFDPAKHELVVSAPPPPPPAPVVAPPPGAPDPLANIAADWRTTMDSLALQSLAAVVGGGRTVENAEQAIAVIDAALLARASK